MSLSFEGISDPLRPHRRVTLTISGVLYKRINDLRRSLEGRFRISLGDEDLIEYLCEKALERMEEWERCTRPGPGSLPGGPKE